MIEIKVDEREDGKFDIYVRFGGNHEDALNSSQGYDSKAEAEEKARRLFGRADDDAIMHDGQLYYRGTVEPVKLTVSGRLPEMIR